MSVPATAGVEGRLGFSITVPDSWYELPLEPAYREDRIRQLVHQQTKGVEELRELRPAIRKVLVEQSKAAWEGGALYCAGFVQPTDEGPLTGSITVTLAEDPRADDESTDWLTESFHVVARQPGDAEAPYTDVSVVEIPGVGSCPRSAGIEDVPLGDEGYLVRAVQMLTAVAVPDLRRVFLVAASSPVIPLADTWLDLFDAVTSTFRVNRLDDRTA